MTESNLCAVDRSYRKTNFDGNLIKKQNRPLGALEIYVCKHGRRIASGGSEYVTIEINVVDVDGLVERTT